MANPPPDGKPPAKPGPEEGDTWDAAAGNPVLEGDLLLSQPEPTPVTIDSTKPQTWLILRNRDTNADIAPNRSATLGIGRNFGADVAFSAPEGVAPASGVYLYLLTGESGNVQLKLASADKKAAIEKPDGIVPLAYFKREDEGWVDFDPKTDKVAFGGLQFFGFRQEERVCVELTVTVGDEGRMLDLGQEILIGREEENGQGQLLSETVSRRHAKIVQTPEGLYIEDRGSMNGTFIARPGEREPIKVKNIPVLLKPGDRVWFGSVKGAESAYLDVVPVRHASSGCQRPDVSSTAAVARLRERRDTLEDDDIGHNKDRILDKGRVDAQ